MNPKNRAKWAYIAEADIQQKIDAGILDQYDVIYTKDTNINFVIDENLQIREVRSRILAFESVEDAEAQLNKFAGTYPGQIVAIRKDDIYRGYIVNITNDTYYVVPLFALDGDIDYDTLGNRPIINLKGTPAKPIDVSSLGIGYYKITGNYIAPDNQVYLSYVGTLFVVSSSNIKKIDSNTIIDYEKSGGKQKVYITDDYLSKNNYITDEALDRKLAALDYITKAEAKQYIEDNFKDVVESLVDKILDERLEGATVEDIIHLFE